ncbi:hypothetical protein TKK_0013149 [Trichogramma kaykai]
MQHEKVSALKRAERTRNNRTISTDRLDSTRSSDLSNTTLASLNSPKRKTHLSRHSTMPQNTSTNLANLRKMELENNNLEMELVYSNFAASYIELYLEEKKKKEAEQSSSTLIKNLSKETKSLQEYYYTLTRRMEDIVYLSCLNDYTDLVQQNTKDFKDKIQKWGINDALLQLKNLLKRFNVLRCENMILPNSPEHMQDLEKVLKECLNALKEVSNPEKCELIEKTSSYYEEFVSIYQEIIQIKKIVEEEICYLQIETLKTCSHALSQNND